jgi:CheY-like chemotaxis protein
MAGEMILVIEDDPLNMKLVRALLQIGKFNILEAGDTEAGLRLAREHSPNLILMDIQLPGMDGLTATRLIKKDDQLREIPVIALTSYAMQGDREKALDAGCSGYLSKPIDTRTFLDSISQLMNSSKQL